MIENVIYPLTKYHGVTRCPNKIDLTLLIDLPWKTSIVRCHYRQSAPERENHTNSCQHPALIRTADRSTKKPQTRSSSAPTPLKRYGVLWFFFETVRIMGKIREKPRDLWCIHCGWMPNRECETESKRFPVSVHQRCSRIEMAGGTGLRGKWTSLCSTGKVIAANFFNSIHRWRMVYFNPMQIKP